MNKLQIFLGFMFTLVTAVLTGIIFPVLISTDKMPLFGIIFVFLVTFFIVGIVVSLLLDGIYLKIKRWKDEV